MKKILFLIVISILISCNTTTNTTIHSLTNELKYEMLPYKFTANNLEVCRNKNQVLKVSEKTHNQNDKRNKIRKIGSYNLKNGLITNYTETSGSLKDEYNFVYKDENELVNIIKKSKYTSQNYEFNYNNAKLIKWTSYNPDEKNKKI